MGSKITISELAIKVRLDSKSAVAGLKNLERKLKTFQDYIKKSLNSERLKVIALNQQISANGKLLSRQKKSNRELRKSLDYMRAMKNSMGSMGNLAKMFVGFQALRSTFQIIKETFKDITTSGMAVNMSRMSLGAAVAASKPAEGLSKAEVDAMSANQQAFAMQVAAKYGHNVAGGTGQYAKFFAAASGNIGEAGTMDMYKSLSKLGVVYGMSGEKMERAMTAFTQMASKNQVMAEELKQQLGDVLPGSMEIFARAMTDMGTHGVVTVEKLYELMAEGKIVASEVFPFVSKEMTRMAEANGALLKATAETATKWNVFKSFTDIFKTSALNQFNGTLGSILDKLTNLFKSKGIAAAVGVWINNSLLTFSSRFDTLLEKIDAFEEKFNNAKTDKEKLKVIDEIFSDENGILSEVKNIFKKVLTDVAQFFVDTLNSITVDDLSGLITTLADVIGSVLKILYEGLAPSKFKDLLDWAFSEDKADGKLPVSQSYQKGLINLQRQESLKNSTDYWYDQMLKKQAAGGVVINGGITTTVEGSSNPTKDAKDINSAVFNDLGALPSGSKSGGR